MNDDKTGILRDIFLREKPSKILLGLKTAKESVYATILSKEADCTYSHTIKILNQFRSLGIVRFEKTGRIKRVMLTDDGWDIAHNLEAILKKFAQIETKSPEELNKEEKKQKSKKGKK
jgi:predicted transcriptional regulator